MKTIRQEDISQSVSITPQKRLHEMASEYSRSVKKDLFESAGEKEGVFWMSSCQQNENKKLVSLKKKMNEQMIGLKSGRLAPNFSCKVYDSSSKLIQQTTLGDLREKNILLFFFPYCFEEGSKQELLDLSKWSSFLEEKLSTRVFCISGDSEYAQREFAKQLTQENPQFKALLISDVSHEIMRSYNLDASNKAMEESKIQFPVRANCFIDKDGIIVDFQVGSANDIRNIPCLLTYLQGILGSEEYPQLPLNNNYNINNSNVKNNNSIC